MSRTRNIILAAVIGIIVVINVYFYWLGNTVVIQGPKTSTTTTTTHKPSSITSGCSVDSDCEWKSTNCCSENSGANWQCVNKNSYVDCQSTQVLCPQVVSPKPSSSCSCVNKRCEG